MRFPFNWYNKFGTIPSSYREAMSYEEQILWLCQQIENLKIESGNFNYNMLENKPLINGVTLEGNISATQLGLDNYNYLLNKPAINGVTLLGNKSLSELDIQGRLTAGSGIRIVGNTISATGGGSGGVTDYDDLTNKPSINGTIVNGDLNGRTYRLQNALINDRSLEINNNYGKVAYLSNYQVNDIIPKEIPEISYLNASYITFNVAKGSYIDIYGNYDIYKINKENKLQLIFSTNGETTGGYLDVTDEGIVVINFFDVGNYTPSLEEYMSGESITQDFDDLDKEIEHNEYDLKAFLDANYDYESLLSGAQEGIFTGIELNNPLPEPSEDSTSRYIKIAKTSNYSCIFDVNGTCNGSYMWFTTEDRSGTEYVVSHSELNMIKNGYVGVDIPENADYIYFQFTNFGASNVLQGLMITEIEGGGGGSPTLSELTSPLILEENVTPTLESGLYLVGAGIYIGSASSSNVVFSYGEIIYYKANSKKFYGDFNIVEQLNGVWSIAQNERIDSTTLSNSRDRIPSSLAVYNALQNAGINIPKLENALVLEDNTTPTLQTGYYLVKTGIYLGSASYTNAVFSYGEIIYYDATNTKFYGNIGIVEQIQGVWSIAQNERTDSVTLSNSRNRIPSSLAVQNAIQNIPTKIDTNLLLENNVTPTLQSGLYVLTNAGIYKGSILEANLMFGSGEIVSYDSSTKTFYGSCFNVYQDLTTGEWDYEENDKIDVTTMTNRGNKFPTSLAVYNGIQSGMIEANHYTTTEKRIGTWIDGKPLYRKVITGTTTAGNDLDISKNSISANIEKFVYFGGTTVQSNNNISLIPYYNSETDRTSIYYANHLNAIRIRAGSEYGFGNISLIVEYTKTTDSGS